MRAWPPSPENRYRAKEQVKSPRPRPGMMITGRVRCQESARPQPTANSVTIAKDEIKAKVPLAA